MFENFFSLDLLKQGISFWEKAKRPSLLYRKLSENISMKLAETSPQNQLCSFNGH